MVTITFDPVTLIIGVFIGFILTCTLWIWVDVSR